MQHSNDNLDELFQRAAEDYPLKIDNKNWDNFASRLHKTAVPAIKQSRKWLYAALLLMLLTGGFFIIIDSSTTKSNSKNPDKQQQEPLNSKKKNETANQKDQPVISSENKIKADQNLQAEKASEYTLKHFDKNNFTTPNQLLTDLKESNVSESQLNNQSDVDVPANKNDIALNPVNNNNSNNSNIPLKDSKNIIDQNINN